MAHEGTPPTEWDLFTKSNGAVQSYLWSLYPDLDRELLLDAFRARMMFEQPQPFGAVQRWEPHVRRMLDGEIECGAMVRHYRHSLIYDHVRDPPPEPEPEEPQQTRRRARRTRRAKRRKR